MKLSGLQQWILYLLILAAAGYWYYLNSPDFLLISILDYRITLLLAPAIIVSLLLIGLSSQVVASHLGAHLGFTKWFSLALASTFVNHFLPLKAGMAIRAAYYKLHCNLPLAHFASLTILLYIVSIGANSTIGLATCIGFYLNDEPSHPEVMLLFAGLLVASMVLLFAYTPRLPMPTARLREIAERVHQGAMLCRNKPSLIFISLALSILLNLCSAVRMYIAFLAIGQDVGVLGCIFLGSIISVSGIISITPAALGIREAAIVLGSLMLGVSPDASLIAGVADRVVSVIIIAALGSVGLAKIRADLART